MTNYRAGAGSYRGRKQWSVGIANERDTMLIDAFILIFIIVMVLLYFIIKGWF